MNIKAKILSPRNITGNNKDFNNVELNVNEEKYKKFVKILETSTLHLNNITFNKFSIISQKNDIDKNDFNKFKKLYNLKLNIEGDKYNKFIKKLEKTNLPLNNITFNKFLEEYPYYKISKTDFNIFKDLYKIELNIEGDKYNKFVKILEKTNLPLNNITFNKFLEEYPYYKISKTDFNIFKDLYKIKLNINRNTMNLSERL
jgi:ribosomal protein L20